MEIFQKCLYCDICLENKMICINWVFEIKVSYGKEFPRLTFGKFMVIECFEGFRDKSYFGNIELIIFRSVLKFHLEWVESFRADIYLSYCIC